VTVAHHSFLTAMRNNTQSRKYMCCFLVFIFGVVCVVVPVLVRRGKK